MPENSNSTLVKTISIFVTKYKFKISMNKRILKLQINFQNSNVKTLSTFCNNIHNIVDLLHDNML